MTSIREENLAIALENILELFTQGLDGDFYVADVQGDCLIKAEPALQDAIIYANYALYGDTDEEEDLSDDEE